MKKEKIDNSYIVFMLIIFTFLFISCNSKYAVGLIETSNIKPGLIYRIEGESFEKRGYSAVSLYQLSYDKTKISELSALFNTFNSKKDAQLFSIQFEKYKSIYAKATADHKIRPEAKSDTSTYYRMAKGQTIKIINKAEEKVIIDGISGFWYEVLTEDGYRGFSFDYRLRIFNKNENSNTNSNNTNFDALAEILTSRFYPEEYEEMIKQNQIDLTLLNENFGFGMNLEKGNLFFITADFNISFSFASIKKLSTNRYFVEDNKLNIIIINNEKLRVTFNQGSREYDFNLILIDNYIKIIRLERAQRRTLYSKLLKLGPIFKSNSYGELTFYKNRTFKWENFQQLVPSIISPTAKNAGKLSFELFLPDELKNKYDDAIKFHFNGTNHNSKVSFFLNIDESNGSIKLRTIPSILIDNDDIIKRENSTSMIIYFKSVAK